MRLGYFTHWATSLLCCGLAAAAGLCARASLFGDSPLLQLDVSSGCIVTVNNAATANVQVPGVAPSPTPSGLGWP